MVGKQLGRLWRDCHVLRVLVLKFSFRAQLCADFELELDDEVLPKQARASRSLLLNARLLRLKLTVTKIFNIGAHNG